MDRPVAGAGPEAGLGLRRHAGQIAQLLVQVFCVGLTLGLARTVIPALAESEFGVPQGSFLVLAAFVVAFGIVKGIMNFVAGRLSERFGRRRVLIWGWLVALPVPVLIWAAPDWSWIVAATILLGINQGLTWSMSQTAKLDLTRPEERGLTLGLDEFAGYGGVAIAGVLTGWAATVLGPRPGLLLFGMIVILTALALSVWAVRETLGHARAETARARAVACGDAAANPDAPRPRWARAPASPTTRQILGVMSWGDRRLAAICQAGLVEKFVDALVWVVMPVFLFAQGLSLTEVGWITGSYGFVWGLAQLLTGPLSDRIGRFWPTVGGMWVCALGVALFPLGATAPWWAATAALTGLGMALLYPNLSAAVADITPPDWRGSAIGVYRFWRDLGYAIGALGLGLAALGTGGLTGAFGFVAFSMAASGLVLWYWGEETHPRLNPRLNSGPGVAPDNGPG